MRITSVTLATGVIAASLAVGTGQPSSATPAPTSGAPTSSSPAATPAELAGAAYDRMTPRQRVGQLFMAGITSTGATPRQLAHLQHSATGNVFLRGHNRIGRTRTAGVVQQVTPSSSVAGVLPYVAVDQEGGKVQALQGAGFSRMPAALVQGTWPTAVLQSRATTWGRQLKAAGVNLDLAPVADVVPKSVGERNKPIGAKHREFGHRIPRVRVHVGAFVRGMSAAQVSTSVKHFPGLGRATGNTDNGPDVTDPTTARSPYLLPFREAIRAGAELVMVSSATYPRIDRKRRACFSPVVMRSILRERLRFTGIVISDSFGSGAVAYLPPAVRAVRYFGAGGTLLLDTNTADLPAMTDAVLSRASTDPAYAAVIEADVRLVLSTKAAHGLVTG